MELLVLVQFITTLIFLSWGWVIVTESTSSLSIALPGCQEKCGNISIPYPFGIGRGCYRDGFEITCNDSSNPPTLTLFFEEFYHRLEILNLSFTDVHVKSIPLINCYNGSGVGDPTSTSYRTTSSMLSTFTHSHTQNKLIVIGCDVFASITNRKSKNYWSGCVSLCSNVSVVARGSSSFSSCSGIGCCQTRNPERLESYDLNMDSINTFTRSWDSMPCSLAFLVHKGFLGPDKLNLSSFQNINTSTGFSVFSRSAFFDFGMVENFMRNNRLPAVMDWAIGNASCQEAIKSKNSSSYACGKNSHWVDSTDGVGYGCHCDNGYGGNPYLTNGCQDINECEDSERKHCSNGDTCTNTEGSYFCKRRLPMAQLVSLGIRIGMGMLLLLAIAFWLCRQLGKRKQLKVKQRFFKQNGGLLLQQQISSNQGSVEKIKAFTIEELEIATDNFNDSRVLGKGGSGTVYKGMLSDGSIIAVKKSEIVNEKQIDGFINEVVILSQINHRSIVKLLGCCLEAEVPLLVYEFVSNGTLSHHLHDEGHMSAFSWKTRLRIATEIAEALAYLHSSASIPIFHRDVKSSNILLDKNYKAKVADFGISRSVPYDKTHLTTRVQGTFGYMDPEYFHSNKFTEKSDVFGFGVVLVELPTGERAISCTRHEDERSLVLYFTSAMKENRRAEVSETRVVNEGEKEELLLVAKLAKSCIKLNGKKRLTMKEVATNLDKLKRFQQ